MKLCLTASGKEMDAKADEKFGRASCFLIVDTDSLDLETIPNTAQSAGQGAGIAAAQIVSDKGAEALLTGIVGLHAFEALRAAGIRIFEGASKANTVQQTIEKFKRGDFREASAPSGRHLSGAGTGRGRSGGRGRR